MTKSVLAELNEELAAEREKYERSQEKVREYFDLLAAERHKRETCEVLIRDLQRELAAISL